MSSAATVARSARPGAKQAAFAPAARAGLRLVTAPERLRSRAALATVSLVLLAVGLVVLLVLAVSVQRGAYQMRQLRAETASLVEQRQGLAEEIAALQAPQALAAQARGLGMVAAPNLAVIRRSDGAVLGEAKPAPRPPARVVPAAPKPSATAKASATPKPAAEPAAAKPVPAEAASEPAAAPAPSVSPAG